MRAARLCIAGLALAFGAAVPAAAQPADGPDRVRVAVDAGVQLSSDDFETTTSRALYLENAAITTSYRVRRGLLGDGGISLRLAGRVSVGLVVSSFTTTNDGDVSASLPHPFVFGRPRTATGTAGGRRRDEVAAHLQGIYTLPPHGRLDVALFAGPSYFRVRQDVVTDISFSDTYPYDTAAFTAASSTPVRANAFGFNAGADVGVRLSRHAGVGGGVRFSQATLKLAVPGGRGTVPADAGGAAIQGGLRLYF